MNWNVHTHWRAHGSNGFVWGYCKHMYVYIYIYKYIYIYSNIYIHFLPHTMWRVSGLVITGEPCTHGGMLNVTVTGAACMHATAGLRYNPLCKNLPQSCQAIIIFILWVHFSCFVPSQWHCCATHVSTVETWWWLYKGNHISIAGSLFGWIALTQHNSTVVYPYNAPSL